MQKKHTGFLVPLLCNILGTGMILAVIAATLPLVVPSFLGYESYNVESGSMEPEIPVGSIVYVHDTSPQDIRPDEIIAYYKDETVITHRVRENRVVEGIFITRGDANPIDDIESVPYAALSGRVEYHLPVLGQVMTLITTDMGKVYLLLVAACGVMFNLLAGRIRLHRKRQITDAVQDKKRAAEQKAWQKDEKIRQQKKLSLEIQKKILETQLRAVSEHERAAEAWYDPDEFKNSGRPGWYETVRSEGRVDPKESDYSKRTISRDIQALKYLEDTYKLDGLQELYDISGLHALLELMDMPEIQKLLVLDEYQGYIVPTEDESKAKAPAPVAAKVRTHKVRRIIMAALAVVFLAATTGVVMVLSQYYASDELYSKAASNYVTKVASSPNRSAAVTQNVSDIISRYSKQSASDADMASQTDNTDPGNTDPEGNAPIIADTGDNNPEGSDTDGTDSGNTGGENTGADDQVSDNTDTDAPEGNTTDEASQYDENGHTEDGYSQDGNSDDMTYNQDESVDDLLTDVDDYSNVSQEGKVYTLFNDSEINAAFVKKLYMRTLDPELIRQEQKYLREHRVFAPVKVDFDSLKAVNNDVKGWIYCEDTIINYPVLYGETNDKYLRHTYDGEYNIAGSIFIETNNKPDLSDSNTIIYGHHMNDGSMFYGLDHWHLQEYYNTHPIMWLLTPKQDYIIVLFSGYTANAYSDTYTIFYDLDEKFDEYIKEALTKSDFKADVVLPSDGKYVLLSTCAYVFDGARYVLHGLLVPVDSAGGVPIW